MSGSPPTVEDDAGRAIVVTRQPLTSVAETVGNDGPRIAVVIPAYKVRRYIADVLARIGPDCHAIYVVDDGCPERSGEYVSATCSDPRIHVIQHAENKGVGAATMTGYKAAIEEGAEIIVKLDGDGQMDPQLVGVIVLPIRNGEADYAKGNRFYDLDGLSSMPRIRVLGNAALSIMSKLSTGYWSVFDPTNGYTAIHADVARHLPFDKISNRYFFETDMLFRLNTLRAVVADVPMDAMYGDEVSNLRVSRIFGEFLFKHARNFFKRLFYNYFLRDVSIASVELVVGTLLLSFGLVFGCYHWWASAREGIATPAGTVMIAGLSILIGIQFILSFLSYDIASTPRRAIHGYLAARPPRFKMTRTQTKING